MNEMDLLEQAQNRVSRQSYFVIAENAFINNPEYTPVEKMVFLSLCTYAGKRNSCFPGQAGIAKNLGISLRTVNATIKSLNEKGGLLIIQQYTETNRKTVNSYFLADINQVTGKFDSSSLDPYRALAEKPILVKGR